MSEIISTIIIIFIISITGSYLFVYSSDYFQRENNRYIRDTEFMSEQNQEQFNIAYVWNYNDFINITVYNYGKTDINISDTYVNGIRVKQYVFGISETILTDSLYQIGFFSPINLVKEEIYEIKIVSTRGISRDAYWESNYTT